MEGGKSKNDIPGHLARVSYPDESRRRFLKFAGLGTLNIAAAASRAHAADPQDRHLHPSRLEQGATSATCGGRLPLPSRFRRFRSAR